MNLFGWQISVTRALSPRLGRPFEDEVLYQLAIIERRLGRIEKDLEKANRDLEQIKDDSSVTRAAVVEIDRTVNGHLKSHDRDAGKPRSEGELRLLRTSPTLTEER